MKPVFSLVLAIFPVLPMVSSIGVAQTANPEPAPAVQLPPVEVTAPRQNKTQPIFETNPLFLHTFADLRSGPMIEAILWRHRYLQNHPQERAVIVTTGRGNRIFSATTVYTLGGRVYGSSNALGERFSIKGLTPADLGTAAGISQATKAIDTLRKSYVDGARPLPRPDDEVATLTLGAALVAAEESGDYRILRKLIDPVAPGLPPPTPTAAVSPQALEAANALAARWDAFTSGAGGVEENLTQPYFQGPSDEIVSWTYEALHSPDRAGIVPASLGQITPQGAAAAVPPFSSFTATRRVQPRQFITFDWEGIQYYYHPDVGTWAKPFPVNSVTGLPDLCVKNGALMECAYFCATYLREHPGKKAALVAGDPVAAAYETDEKLGLFIPTLGGFTVAKQYLTALDDRDYLGQLRDQVVEAKLRQKTPADAIPDEMPGDDGDMQMRRAFLAFQAAGISCHLHEENQPYLEFSWEGVSYVYNSNQQVQTAAAASTPETSAPTLPTPDIKAPSAETPQLAGPVIPDHTFQLPEAKPEPPLAAASGPEGQSTAADQENPAAASATSKLVVMPPLVVSATRISKNPWRYVSVPGFEILTRASDVDTDWDLDGLRHGLWIQQAIIPKEWFPELPVPCTVIIDNTNLASIRAGQPHSQQIVFGAPTDALTWGRLSGKADVSSEPVSSDSDTFAINSNLYGVVTQGATYASINLDRLRLGAPPLPHWVIAGLLGRNGLFREGFVIFDPSHPTDDQPPNRSLRAAVHSSNSESRYIESASGPGTFWISVAETQRLLQELKQSKDTQIPLLPLGELFAEDPPAESDHPLWESEAGLLVRWGLMGPGHDNSALSRRFLAFVKRARQEPVTEEMFTACFGFGYAAMEDKLESFLRSVLAQPTSVDHLAMPVTFDMPRTKAATADQVARMLGDWLRMQGDSLRGEDPEITAACLDSAGQMLLRAYRDDNALPPEQSSARDVTANLIQDPMLLAIYGLYEHDTGNDGKAREFLEAAVKANVVRPRAYQVLAELRYAAAIAKPAGANGRISGQQAATVLEPLKTALRFPPSLDLYNLMVDTWGRCDARAASEDIKTLLTGATLFPRSTILTFKSALVCARNGYRSQAIELVHQGLALATEAVDRSRLEKLRSILENSPAAAAK